MIIKDETVQFSHNNQCHLMQLEKNQALLAPILCNDPKELMFN